MTTTRDMAKELAHRVELLVEERDAHRDHANEADAVRCKREHERNRWQTRAESAENRVEELADQRERQCERLNALKARVEELATENARLEQEATAYDLRISRLAKERDDLRAKVERLKGEHAVKVEVLPDMSEFRREVIKGLHSTVRSLQWKLERTREERDRLRTAVPRVIRPDEIQVGQKIAWTGWESGDWYIQTATTNGGAFAPGYPGTIVLLSEGGDD